MLRFALVFCAAAFLSVTGCSPTPPPSVDSHQAASHEAIAEAFAQPGEMSQRQRAMLQAKMAVAEFDSLEFQTHYDWDGTTRVTARWDIRPETRLGRPSFVTIHVPKGVGEENLGAAAAAGMRDSEMRPFRFWLNTLMPTLLRQAVENGGASTDGFNCWAWECETISNDEHAWEFLCQFKPVAEGFDRDEMDAAVR